MIRAILARFYLPFDLISNYKGFGFLKTKWLR